MNMNMKPDEPIDFVYDRKLIYCLIHNRKLIKISLDI